MIYLATGHSHVGKRENNEDVFLFTEDLFLVADGIGGHQAGEVASTAAAVAIEKTVEQFQSGSAAEVLRQAVINADQFIYKRGRAKREHSGMGTTIVALLFRAGIAAVSHAGDSRCYRMRQPGNLEQITQDHAAKGSHIIHRSLGGGNHEGGEMREFDVKIGDVYLLCSDGLNVLSDKRIEDILRDGGEAEDLVLAALALDEHHQDNVTALVLRVVKGRP